MARSHQTPGYYKCIHDHLVQVGSDVHINIVINILITIKTKSKFVFFFLVKTILKK